MAIGEDEEGWHLVKGKKKRSGQKKMDIAGTGWRDNGEKINTFYFSEIPDTHGAREMMKAFAYYGDVIEVVIPFKRNSRGQRFGFVRFRNVKDLRNLSMLLDSIIIGAKKIFVNTPKYQRESNEKQIGVNSKGYVKEIVGRNQKSTNEWHEKRGEGRKEGKWVWKVKQGVKSRVGEDEATGNKSKNVKENQKPWMERRTIPEQRVVYYRKKNLHELVHVVPEEEMKKFEKMYVGELRCAGSAHMVQEWFNSQGVFSVKTTPLGANLVLIEEFEDGMVNDLIKDAEDMMFEKFRDIRPWSPREYDNERVVWVRCHGIPVHAWNNDFFEKIARQLGVFLGVDENTRKKTSMDVARILVRTKGFDVFNMVIHAQINGIPFHIKVLEEWCGPMHWDGLTQAKGSNKEDDSDSENDSDDDDGPPLFREEAGSHGGSDEEEEDKRVEISKSVSILEGKLLENGMNANDEEVNVTLEDGEDLCSTNGLTAQNQLNIDKENSNVMLENFEGLGLDEVEGQSCEVVEEWLDERGPQNGGVLVETIFFPEEKGEGKTEVTEVKDKRKKKASKKKKER